VLDEAVDGWEDGAVGGGRVGGGGGKVLGVAVLGTTLVFESPVWSGYFAHLALTETETS